MQNENKNIAHTLSNVIYKIITVSNERFFNNIFNISRLIYLGGPFQEQANLLLKSFLYLHQDAYILCIKMSLM